MPILHPTQKSQTENNLFSNRTDFFLVALSVSVVIHLIIFGSSIMMPSKPQVAVVQATSSLEIVIVRAMVPSSRKNDEKVIEKKDEKVINIEEEDVFPKDAGSRVRISAKQNISSKEFKGALTQARPLAHKNAAPVYPRLARQRGLEGILRLKVFVETTGLVGKVIVDKSSGHKTLDQAALKAVKKWQFLPAQSGFQKVSSWIIIPIQFMLNNQE